MPQIFIMLSPKAQKILTSGVIAQADADISAAVISAWKVPETDVACSALPLIYARGEADVQIEIRYTAGKDEYDRGVPFAPTEEDRRALIRVMEPINKQFSEMGLSCSAWTKSYKESTFVIYE